MLLFQLFCMFEFFHNKKMKTQHSSSRIGRGNNTPTRMTVTEAKRSDRRTVTRAQLRGPHDGSELRGAHTSDTESAGSRRFPLCFVPVCVKTCDQVMRPLGGGGSVFAHHRPASPLVSRMSASARANAEFWARGTAVTEVAQIRTACDVLRVVCVGGLHVT